MSVPPEYANRTCGLCGQYNGNASDDLEAADGHVYRPSSVSVASWSARSRLAYHMFGRSWSIEGCERLLVDHRAVCLDNDTPPPAPCQITSQAYAKAVAHCSVLTDKRGPYRKCHDLVDPATAYRSCLYDVCACGGDTGCACDVLLAYETQCHTEGVLDIDTVIDECGVCFGDGSSCLTDGATCQVSGDPHYRTFDNSGHHFQGGCEYVLAKDCLWNDFEVHVQNEHRGGNSAVSWTKAVAIKIRDVGVVHLLAGRMATFNSTAIETFHYVVKKDGTIISKFFGGLKVRLASSGVVVTFDGHHVVEVTIPEYYKGRMCGLCGDYDGQWHNDLMTDFITKQYVNASSRYYSPSTQSLKAYLDFGKAWAARGCDRLLLSENEICLEPDQPEPPPCLSHPELKTVAIDYCSVITSGNGPYATCHAVVDSSLYYQSCLFDACACHSSDEVPECVCSTIKAYEQACRKQRVWDIGTVVDKCGKCFTDGTDCSRQGAICQVSGDPHYVTFDGSGHHFQGNCEYILAKDCLDDDFQVNVRNEHRGSTTVTWTHSVAIQIPNVAVIRLLRDSAPTVNNIPVEFYPYTVPGDGTVIESLFGRTRVTLTSSGVTVTWDGNHLVEVYVPAEYLGRTCGLCGVYDDDNTNDLELRNGTVVYASALVYSRSQQSVVAYHTFGTSWAVTGDEVLLTTDSNGTCVEEPYKPDPCRLNPQLQLPAEAYCRFISDRQGPYSKCHAVVDPRIHYHSCVYDHCGCGGNTACACRAVQAYEALCRRRGVRRLGSVIDKCGICFGDGSSCTGTTDTCIAYGDTHYRTFDGVAHDFQGKCEYVLVSDNGRSFNVTARNVGQSVTYTRAVGISIRGVGRIRLEGDMSVWINDRELKTFPYYIINDGTAIDLIIGGVRVKLGNSGLQVIWNGISTVQIISPVSLKGRLNGLCGQYDGNRSDDFTGPDGTIYSSSHEFGLSWSVNGAERLILDPDFNCTDSVQPPRHPCDINPQAKPAAQRYCKYINDPIGPYAPCHETVDPTAQFRSCMYDVCHCGGSVDCACTVVKAYESLCLELGVRGLGSVVDECGKCLGSGPPCEPDGGGPGGATCSASGDPHYKTFDGLWHHFQGLCEYVLSKDNVSEDFIIHQRNERCGSRSCTRSIAILTMDGHVIKLLQGGTVQVDSTDPDKNLPKQVGVNLVYWKGGYIVVSIAVRNGEVVEVRFDGSHYVDVTVPASYRGRVYGLCGTFTGTTQDDFTFESGDSASGTHLFGVHWAVEPRHRLLLPINTSCADPPHGDPHPCDGKPHIRTKAEEYCGLISDKQGPYLACHQSVNPVEFYDSCVYDVCECDADNVCVRSCQSL